MPYLSLRGHALSWAAMGFVVAPAFLTYGYNQVGLGGVLTLGNFVETFPAMDTITTQGAQRSYNSNIQGTVVALYLVGGMFGSLSLIWAGDSLGRKKCIFISSVVSLVGAILMFTSFSLAQLIVSRLILGFGTGGYVATVPVWHAELSKPSKRGADVVSTGFFIGLGIALALWIDFGLYFVKDSSISWRLPLALQVVPTCIVIASIFFMPESPRWLLKKGRVEEARMVLLALSNSDITHEDAQIDDNLTRIQSSLTLCQNTSFFEIFKSDGQRLLHRTSLAVLAGGFQQICGINALSFYATVIFQQYLGLSPTLARILAAAMATTQPVGGVVAYFAIDRVGRRKLLLIAASSMAVLMAVLAGTTSAVNDQPALVVACIALFLFPFIFTVGFAGLCFLYATEVAPSHHRAAVNGLSTASVWVTNFLMAQVTPVGFDTIGYRYYIIFAVLNFAMMPVVYFFFPETSGMALEQIDEIFLESENIFDPPRVARRIKMRQIGQRSSEDGIETFGARPEKIDTFMKE